MKKDIVLSSVFAVLSLLAFAGCGKDNPGDGSNVGGSLSLSYDYMENGCKTEKHTANSDAAYCSQLKDNSLNHGCAEDMRRNAFQTHSCAGKFDG